MTGSPDNDPPDEGGHETTDPDPWPDQEGEALWGEPGEIEGEMAGEAPGEPGWPDESDPFADEPGDEVPPPVRPRWAALEAALDALATSPFVVSGVAACAPPVVRVHGEALTWPLSESGRRALRAACARSGYGDGGRTVIDPRVRSAWELDPAQLSVEGLDALLERALEAMSRALGEGPLRAELYKLMHYERGDHFREHRDGVKQPGMIGTLLIGLPGEHRGGELRVRLRGDERSVRLSSTPTRTSFAGFYADCIHELTPIEQGSRTCLIFLVMRASEPSDPTPWSAPVALVEALEQWLADPTQPDQIVAPLAHCYPGKTPTPAELRGHDRSTIGALLAAARVVGCAASLCTLELEHYQYSWDSYTMTLTAEGASAEEAPLSALLWPWLLGFLPRVTGGGAWTGNESEPTFHRYQHAAVRLRRPPAPPGSARVDEAHEDLRACERRALVTLLDRAHARRWRRLDLDPLYYEHLPRSDFRGLARLAPHLEELHAPICGWLAGLWNFHRLRHLHLEGSDQAPLRDLPPEMMGRLHTLTLPEKLDLSREAPAALAAATSLWRLDLTGGESLRALPDALAAAPLRVVRLGKTGLRELPGWLGANGLLEELDASECAVSELPPGVLSPSLRALDLRSTRVSALDLTGATGLQRLHLDHCPITDIPYNLAECERLEALTLAAYANIPQDLTDRLDLRPLTSLRHLSLVSLHLRGLPALLEPCLLETLHLDQNRLSALPASVGRMNRLRELSAVNNGLEEVPELSALTRLRVLDLGYNALSRVPGVERLRRLEVLNLGGCARLEIASIEALPASLRSLSLYKVPLGVAPSWLQALPELDTLNLSGTHLTRFDVEPGALRALQTLDLSYNRLSEPPRVELLPSLRDLELSQNPLTSLPSMAGWGHLRRLQLTGTLLTGFTIEPGELPALSALELSSSPLASMPRVELLPALRYLTLGSSIPRTPQSQETLQTLMRRGIEVDWCDWDESDEAESFDDAEPPDNPESGSDDIPFLAGASRWRCPGAGRCFLSAPGRAWWVALLRGIMAQTSRVTVIALLIMGRVRAWVARALTTGLLVFSGTAVAQPPAAQVFCEVYKGTPGCAQGAAECTTCHDAVPGRNSFGRSVEKFMLPGEARPLTPEAFAAALPAALASVEASDADGDGVSNLDEIKAGSTPSDAQSKPAAGPCVPTAVGRYQLCNYDAAYVLRKVSLDFCGQSATMAQQAELKASADPKAYVHKVLDGCLKTEHWRGKDGVVWNLANKKIRPSASIKSGKNAGPVPLGDYEDDYALFVYTQIDNHDARDLLLARYFVERIDGPPTTYETFDRTPVQDFLKRGEDGAQVVDGPHRAGMVTTRWFAVAFTMFTPLPRTTAAQAYRAYLGRDIALQEGLVPVPSEPRDYDSKGVAAPECASCHATLDPLTYPFSRYGGLDSLKWLEKTLTSYWTERLYQFPNAEKTDLVKTPEAGVIFGQAVANLTEWAEVAANSNEFSDTLVMNYWKELFGGPPSAEEQPTFANLSTRLRTVHGHGVERMLHDLIDTEVYGVP